MKTTRFLSVIAFLLISATAIPQKIELTSELDYKSSTRDIYPLDNGTFYSYTFNPNLTLLIFKEGNATPVEKKLKLVVNGVTGDFNQFAVVNNKLYVFFRTKKLQLLSLYAQEIDQSGEFVGVPKEVCNYEIVKKQEYGYFIGINPRQGYFNLVQSQNKKYLLVENNDNIIGAEDGEFRFKVLDENLNVVNQGAYLTRSAVDAVAISSQYLSNSGEFVISALRVQKGSTQGRAGAKHIVWSFTDGKLKESNLEVDEKRLLDYKILVREGVITCRGFYSNDKSKENADGIFYAEIYPEENTIGNVKYDELEQSSKFRAIVDQLDVMEDGSVVMLAQFCYSVQTGSQIGFNNIYDQILACKFEPDGTIKWTQLLGNFFQTSFTNTYVKHQFGYASGNGIYNVLVNRALNDVEGKLSNDPAAIKSGEKRDVRKNVLVNLELDLTNGEVNRHTIELPLGSGLAIVAESSCVEWNSKTVFLKFSYARGLGKECFGRIKI